MLIVRFNALMLFTILFFNSANVQLYKHRAYHVIYFFLFANTDTFSMFLLKMHANKLLLLNNVIINIYLCIILLVNIYNNLITCNKKKQMKKFDFLTITIIILRVLRGYFSFR